jgi:hypothetical protein
MLAFLLETWSNVKACFVIHLLHVKGVTLVKIYCCLLSTHVLLLSKSLHQFTLVSVTLQVLHTPAASGNELCVMQMPLADRTDA